MFELTFKESAPTSKLILLESAANSTSKSEQLVEESVPMFKLVYLEFAH